MAVATKERTLTMAQAISEAIGQEMERDERVFVMGEDVGSYGGIFSATSGLLDRFGPERIMDTPISRGRLHRRRDRRRGAGAAPDRGADVRRLLRRVHGSDLQPPREEHVHVGRQRAPAGRDHDRDRRRLQRRGPALAVPVRDVRAHARAEGRRAVERLRRQGADDRGDPRRQPGDVLLPQGDHGPAVDVVLRGLDQRRPRRGVHGPVRRGRGRASPATTSRSSRSARWCRRRSSPPRSSRPTGSASR